MFENCTIKYVKFKGVNDCIKIIYPQKPSGSHKEIIFPIDAEDNRHHIEVMEWVAEGNTIEEAD